LVEIEHLFTVKRYYKLAELIKVPVELIGLTEAMIPGLYLVTWTWWSQQWNRPHLLV